MKTSFPIMARRAPTWKWHLVNLPVLTRAILRGWEWWHDPRTAQPVLKSRTGQLYRYRYQPRAGAILQRMENVSED